jgi:hypothetical protein
MITAAAVIMTIIITIVNIATVVNQICPLVAASQSREEDPA